MVAYKVDWGDAEPTVVSGVEMRDRPNEKNPHSLYHLYDYWDLKNKGLCTAAAGVCDGVTSCCLQPKVYIKDNWGWYSKGTVINTPPAETDINAFTDYIIVKEK